MKVNLKHRISKMIAFVLMIAVSFGNIYAIDTTNSAAVIKEIISEIATESAIDIMSNDIVDFNNEIFLVGDSTVCEYDEEKVIRLNRQGWGMQLGEYFDESVRVNNLALSGRSSRSFVAEKNYETLCNDLSEGSYLFIQFGHNDEKLSSEEDKLLRGTYPNLSFDTLNDEGMDSEGRYSFEWYLLEKYIKVAREKGAQPILVTPIVRRSSKGSSNIKDHIPYTAAIKKLAEEYNIPCIDLTTKTDALYKDLYDREGADATAELHAWKDPELKTIDNTHLSIKGAKVVSELVVESIKELDLKLAEYIVDEEEEVVEGSLVVDSRIDATNEAKRIFKTVTEAVNYAKSLNPASEEERVVIEIVPGTYREQIVIETPYITLCKKTDSDIEGEVVITWYYGIGYVYKSVGEDGFYNPNPATWWSDDELGQADSNVRGGIKGKPDRWGTTVNITSSAKHFIAKDITFENSFNQYMTEEEIADGVKPESTKPERTADLTDEQVQTVKYRERAAAMHVRADRVIFENCQFISKQDTLYIDGRVYFEECMIEGTTDFIFGSAAAVFNECEIYSNFGEGETGGYITAASTSSAQEYGYLFYKCDIIGNLPTVYGRPWGQIGGPQVTMYKSKLQHGDQTISSVGWANMNITSDQARFYEYGTVNSEDGQSIDLSNRIKNTVAEMGTAITKWQALDLNPYNYLKGTDEWDPMNVKEQYVGVQNAIEAFDLSEAEGVEINESTKQYKVSKSFKIPEAPAQYDVKIVSQSDFVTIEGQMVNVVSPAFGSSARDAKVIMYMVDKDNDEIGAKREVELVLLPGQSEDASEAIKLVKAALDEEMQMKYADENGKLLVNSSMNLQTKNDNFIGYTYTWESNQPEVISAVGNVIRPSFEENDTEVILKCTITDGKETVEATYTIYVPKMPYGTWENFEGATLGDTGAGAVKWTAGKYNSGWESLLDCKVVDNIDNVDYSNQGKFLAFKQTGLVGGSTSGNIDFKYGDVTSDNITEMTVDFLAANGSGKMELYFRASGNQLPIRPQFNNGNFKGLSSAMKYTPGKWYTLKMIADTTDEKAVYDFYILDENNDIVAFSEGNVQSSSATAHDVTYVQLRHDRKSSGLIEMYFDNFGFINYTEAAKTDLAWVSEYLESNKLDLKELPLNGPRGTVINYESVSGDHVVGANNTLYQGTGEIRATVKMGYLNGDNSKGETVISEAVTVTVLEGAELAKDFEALKKVYNETKIVYTPDREAEFTAETWEALMTLLDEAEAVISGNKSMTQEEVDELTLDIKEAVLNLKEYIKTVTIHLAGDSTVKKYNDDQMIGGWGEVFNYFVDETHVIVKDYAHGGRSSRSFINEGRLIDNGKFTGSMEPAGMGPISESIQSGDYLFIQFGHNDDASKGYSTMYDRMVPIGTPDENGIYPTILGEKTSTKVLPQEYIDALNADKSLTDEAREAAMTKALATIAKYGDEYYAYGNGGTYKGFLKQYIDFARTNGATPVLITPVSRKNFDENGKIRSVPGHHGGSNEYHDFTYVEAVRQLAEEENVILIDLFTETVEIYETLGKEDSNYLQSILEANGKTIDGNWVQDFDKHIENSTFGRFDGTHQNKYGAYLFAGKLAESLLEQKDVELGNENLKAIAPYIKTVPTAYIDAPNKLISRLKDISKLYNLVEVVDSCLIEEDKPETDKPEIDKPETNKPETNKPETNKPETDKPETNKPETDKPETDKPETDKPETDKPETDKPETDKPETDKPETDKPETNKPSSGSGSSSSVSKPNLESNTNGNNGVSDNVNKPVIKVEFEDIHHLEWARDAIEKLASIGIVNGMGNGKFEPSVSIKRGDFILMICNLLGLDHKNIESFDDVDVNKYYAGAISKAKEIGLITGAGNNTFRPEEAITRQDAMCIMSRALEYKSYVVDKSTDKLNSFNDTHRIASYAVDSVATLVNAKVVKGNGAGINPVSQITRAEASVLIANIYSLLNEENQKTA